MARSPERCAFCTILGRDRFLKVEREKTLILQIRLAYAATRDVGDNSADGFSVWHLPAAGSVQVGDVPAAAVVARLAAGRSLTI